MYDLKNRFPLVLLLLASSSLASTDKPVYGLHEKVRLIDIGNTLVKAKLDTGALTSSLGATGIKIFNQDGEKWVKFKPQIKGKDLPEMTLPLERKSKIKRRLADLLDDNQKLSTSRPVVQMDICIDGKVLPIEVNLTDRSHFNYPLLIGSSALVEFNAVVDPSLRYQSKPDCQ